MCVGRIHKINFELEVIEAMTEQTKMDEGKRAEGISEAERMARIRELLVGPVIADESARVDQSVGRLDQTIADQAAALARLQEQLDRLESSQRETTERLHLRLLGMVEALLTDEQGLRARLVESEAVRSYLRDADEKRALSDQAD